MFPSVRPPIRIETIAIVLPKNIMSSKRARRVAVASATAAPVDPNAASPIDSACARRADNHCGLAHHAAHQILRQVGVGQDVEFSDYKLRTHDCAPAVAKSGMIIWGAFLDAGLRGDEAHPLRFEHALDLVWELVADAMDKHAQSTIPVEDIAVVATARRLIVAAVAAENCAYADTFGEPIPVEDCVDTFARLWMRRLAGRPSMS